MLVVVYAGLVSLAFTLLAEILFELADLVFQVTLMPVPITTVGVGSVELFKSPSGVAYFVD